MNPDVTWSTREKLAIASYVFHTGDQHWTGSVSRILRPLGEPDRPHEWFSSKNCAQQYTALLESAEKSRRKRSERSDSSDSGSSTSLQSPAMPISETILRKVTQERTDELRRLIRIERMKYKKITQTMEQIQSGDLDDQLPKLLEEFERNIPKAKDGSATKEESRLLPPPSETESQIENVIDVNSEKMDSVAESSPIPFSVNSEDSNGLPSLSYEQTIQSKEDTSEVFEHNTSSAEDLKHTSIQLTEQNPKADPDSIPQISQSSPSNSTEREETSAADETLPTSAPVIESDSSDDGIEVSQTTPRTHGDSNVCSDIMDADEVENSFPVQASETNSECTNLPLIHEQTKPVLTCQEEKSVVLEATDNGTFVQPKPILPDESAKADVLIVDQDAANKVSMNDDINSTSLDASDNFQRNNDIISSLTQSSLPSTSPKRDELLTNEPELVEEDSSQSTDAKDEFEVEQFPDEDGASHKSASVAGDDHLEEEPFADYSMSTESTPAYSFPSSPALSNVSDLDPESTAQSRAWKKSIMILWKQVASHRFASIFLQPVTDDIAPNYSSIVYRPMDLLTLKKNVETGVVRTTSDFQRDLMLMFQNALMYNNSEHDVYKMTQEMQKDVMDQVAQFLATQLMLETSKQSTPKGLRRSTLRKSVMSEKVNEARGKRTTGS